MDFVDGNDGTRSPQEARDEWAKEVHAEAKDIPALRETSTELLAMYTSYAEDGAPSDATWDGSVAFTAVCTESGFITDF